MGVLNLLIMTLFLLVVFPYALPREISSKAHISYPEKVALGVFLSSILLAVTFYLNPFPKLNPLLVLSSIISMLAIRNFSLSWKSVEETKTRRFQSPAIYFSSFTILLLIFFLASPGGIRYHSSPDNHALASTIGYMEKSFSHRFLSDHYMEITGLKNNDFFGQPSPKFDSVWSIPDAQLRFVADNVFQVGRIAMPALGSTFGRLLGEPTTFPNFVLLMGVLGIWICGLLTWRISQDYLTIVKSSHSRTSNESLFSDNKRSLLFENLFSLFYTTSLWAIVFILEGSVNQIWFFVTLLLTWKTFSGSLLAQNSLPKRMSLFICCSSALYLALAYPNGVFFFSPFLLVLFLSTEIFSQQTSKILSVSLIKNSFSRKYNWIFPGIALGTLVVSIWPIQGSIKLLTSNFIKGAPNQPFTLGPVGIHEILLGFMSDIRPEAVAGFGTGFTSLQQTSANAIISLICFVFFLGLLVIYSRIKYSRLLIFLLPFALVLIAVIVVLMVSLLRFQVTFWPYQYLRNLVNLMVLSFPITVFLFRLLTMNKEERIHSRKYSRLKNLVVQLLLVLHLVSLVPFLNGFRLSSAPFNTLNFDHSTYDAERTFFISDVPIHELYQLTLFGPLYYLTDGWQAIYGPSASDTPFEVIYISKRNGKLNATDIGAIRIETRFKGPMTMSDLQNIKK